MNRLDELKRQRALLSQHLAWLDREIAGAAGIDASTTLTPSTPTDSGMTQVVSPQVPPATIALPADLVHESQKHVANARRGCFAAFALFLLALAAAAIALYFLKYR